jgi:hypothetical protein
MALREYVLTLVQIHRHHRGSSNSSSPGTAQHSLQTTARPAHPSEPILVPKLRIYFADFPYLHYSNNQRLFTLETCCGYGYGRARDSYYLPWIFKGRHKHTGHRKSRGALRLQHPYLRSNRFHGVETLQRKDNSSQGLRRRLQVRLRYRIGTRKCNLRVSVWEY